MPLLLVFTRGGDHELHLRRNLSIGSSRDAERILRYSEASLTSRALTA